MDRLLETRSMPETSIQIDAAEVVGDRRGACFSLGQVYAVIQAMASPIEIQAMSNVFRAAAEPLRAKILCALLETDELCVCDISAAVSASQSAVSRQLRFLREQGIVQPRKAAQLVFYRLSDECIKDLLRLCLKHVRHSAVRGDGTRGGGAE